jgi:diadenosine tetraphosphate (Ap4A) HIT family hydrolase
MENFEMDSRLTADSSFVTKLNLCQVRLHHNAAFPWILLIPMQANVKEIIDLTDTNQQLLLQEIVLASKIMKELYNPTKLNVASLGNIVAQLHVHVIARYDHDAAWPNPVWNSGITNSYHPQLLSEQITNIADAFAQS